MSWFVIYMLVFIMIVFAMANVLFIVWVIQGSPEIEPAQLLELTGDEFGILAATQASLPKVDVLAGERLLLAANTGGYVIQTGTRNDGATDDGTSTPNKFVQTLFIDGKPAVTRTTTFAQSDFVERQGPMEIRSERPQQEVVKWYNANKEQNGGLSKDFLSGSDLERQLLEESRPIKTLSTDLEPSLAVGRRQEHIDYRRQQLLPALIATEKRRHEVAIAAEVAAQEPYQFHLKIMAHPLPCSTSSKLSVAVELTLPQDFKSPEKEIRWLVHRINSEEDDDGDAKSMQPLWVSDEPISVGRLIKHGRIVEVLTELDCSNVGHWLLRLRMADATTNSTLATVFFNPSSIISNSTPPDAFGHTRPHAWITFKKIHRLR